ncbi:MAG: GPW/gp25 family protein [Chloroflexi bacterium]|nr:GPW/gp25 family protein [Chloroflexota bacterium]
MDKGKIFGRGISFPPRLGSDGRIAWSEGEDNIRESIRIILLTEMRERLRLPIFGGGLRQFLFEPNTVATRHAIQDRITKVLAAWEPRIQIDAVNVDADPSDEESAVATITYKLVATQTLERVTLNVRLKD